MASLLLPDDEFVNLTNQAVERLQAAGNCESAALVAAFSAGVLHARKLQPIELSVPRSSPSHPAADRIDIFAESMLAAAKAGK